MEKLFLKQEVDNGLRQFASILTNNIKLEKGSQFLNRKLLTSLDLNPYLFGYFNYSKELTLDQILGSRLKKKATITVNSDENGLIYFPKIGYFNVEKKKSQFTMLLDSKNPLKSIVTDSLSKNVSFKFTPVVFLKNTKIELTLHMNSYLSDQFKQAKQSGTRQLGRTIIEKDINKYCPYISKAIVIIAEIDKRQHNEIMKTCHKTILFKAKEIIAFTSINLHGAIFIKPRNFDTEVFFVDHLIHESSHIALNCVFLNIKDYFTIDPFVTQFKSPFRIGEARGAYHTFHACYVLSKLLNFYNKWESKGISKKHYFDVIGRLLLAIHRLEEGLSYINVSSIFTKKGYEIFSNMNILLSTVKNQHQNLIKKYSIENQPIEFDLKLFIESNNLKNSTLVLNE